MSQCQPIITTACLFVDLGEPSQDGFGPTAAMGAATILDGQIAALSQGGIRDIVIYCHNQSRALMAIIEQWQGRVSTIRLVANKMQLAQELAASPLILVMANNVMTRANSIAAITTEPKPLLFVRDAPTSDDRHERIDLSDRWTGLAVLPSTFFHDMPEIDEDWSLQSALLRHAVQNGVARETLAVGPLAPHHVEVFIERGDVERWQARMKQTHFDIESAGATPFRRWVALPLSRLALSKWHPFRPEISHGLQWGAVGSVLLAILLAVLQWPLSALIVLFMGVLIAEVDRQNKAIAVFSASPSFATPILSITWFLFPMVALFQNSGGNGGLSLLIGALVSTAVGVTMIERDKREHLVVTRDEALVITLLLMATGFPIMESMVLSGLAALLSGFWRQIELRLKPI